MRLKYLIFLILLSGSVESSITISGKVTDKSGNLVTTCDVFFNPNSWIDKDSIHTKCDDKGNYSISIEKGQYNSVYICDEELYGVSKLEFWAWNMLFEESQTLNAQFDSLEIFSLATWASNGGSNSIFASFRPMSLLNAKSPSFDLIETEMGKRVVFDISPSVNASSIEGFIDDRPIELLGYYWTYESVPECGVIPKKYGGINQCVMPMIIAQFRKPKMEEGLHILKINVRDADTGDFGQGMTQFKSNPIGLGF